MADEKIPNPEGILPGKPAPYPAHEVVMAGPPPAARTVNALQPEIATEPESPHHSETALFLRWMTGMILVLVLGWGLYFGVPLLLTRRFSIDLSYEVITAAGAILSFISLYLLETDLWLSKFMCLRLGPSSTPLKETLFFWLLGVPGLLIRSSAADKPAPNVIKSTGENDGTREIIETVVFVVVLVLMLKTFLAEAFVIPTGSMADTLLGYHKQVTCEKCRYRFLVNCSSEVDPQPGQMPKIVVGGICPNCRYQNELLPKRIMP